MAMMDHSWKGQLEGKVEGTAEAGDAREMQRCAERIWNAISRYVSFEQDAIFKDPNWPHLWDKK